MANSEMDEIVVEFLIESREGLDQLDTDLVELEQRPEDQELIDAVFRCVHTLKGGCGFLGLGKLERLSHVGENLLSLVRDGRLRASTEITTVLLQLGDALREILENVEQTREEGDADYSQLVSELKRLAEEDATNGRDCELGGDSSPNDPESSGRPSADRGDAARADDLPTRGGTASDKEGVSAESGHSYVFKRRGPASDEGDHAGPGNSDMGNDALAAEETSTSVLHARTGVEPAEQSAAAPTYNGTPANGDPPGDESPASTRTEASIRVSVGHLDRLMNLVGELVLTRNQILQFTQTAEDASLLATSQRLNLITTELQEGVMKSRMQPIGNLWAKLPRVVRDLSTQLGRKVRLEVEGKETELDRTILEAIKDPLTHIVRNSIDHGIEPPAQRLAAGKPEEGVLALRAYHEGGQVNIEISDDGKGINVEVLKQKAVEKGVLSPEKASTVSTRDIANLIFAPGLSTAEALTNVSGRGVGMDVVRTNIERIGGSIDIHTRAGEGTTLKIKIPLTLAIIPALIIKAKGERYAIPQVSLLELVRLESGEGANRIESVHESPVYRLRGALLPLVYLNRELGLASGAVGDVDPESAGEPVRIDDVPGRAFGPQSDDGAVNIVVLQAADQPFGLVVDEILDTEEIVVKPLTRQLKGLGAYAGATVMGDGRVSLIVDVLGIAERAGVGRGAQERVARQETNENVPTSSRQTLLVVEHNGRRIAVPLDDVARLEEFSADRIESSGGIDVVQYRDEIMPLISLDQALSARTAGGRASVVAGDEVLQVVVCSREMGSVGLVVDQIVDIVEEEVRIERDLDGQRPVHSLVLQGRVTDRLAVEAVLDNRMPDLAPAPSLASVGPPERSRS